MENFLDANSKSHYLPERLTGTVDIGSFVVKVGLGLPLEGWVEFN